MTRTFGGVMVAALLLLLAAVAPVAAHAELDESDPAEGETITTPYTLTATFNEEVGTDRSRIVVTNAAGEEVARGGISEDDSTVMMVELPTLEPGDYTAGWTAVTPGDNGVTRGEIHFTVAQPATPSPRATSAPSASAGITIAPAQTASPAPTPTPTPGTTPAPDGGGSAASGDALLALGIAAVALLALCAFLFTRSRN